ncbi:radial spoke head protein 6 homolog A [Condylostylus longicornis]|uniref:radial spoke head protein 6 homolog A n=1 Tax=Condylostylus longicornis TaxID=2530218 RepID=UPI00244DEDEF|nr:radial spoke head protein 6 homolog A [Condylostylus longicornis]
MFKKFEISNEEEKENKILSSLTKKESILEVPITMKESILEVQLHWSLCGIGLGLEISFQLVCAMQRLLLNSKIKNIRFWGMIFGLHKSYYIVECDLLQSEILLRQSVMLANLDNQRNEFIRHEIIEKKFLGDINLLNSLVPGQNFETIYREKILKSWKEISIKKCSPLPKSDIKKNVDVSPELIGQGLNEKTYFVVNNLTDDWVELPIVTPKQLTASRKITKFFTGNLGEKIYSYPKFPGVEKHYLRSIIARITASTYIAPRGYYQLQTKKFPVEPESEDEEGKGEEYKEKNCRKSVLVKNEKYISPRITELLAICFWEHIRPSILEHGRVDCINAEQYFRKTINFVKNEEEAKENLEGDPPPIFFKCENDTIVELASPWTIRLSSVHNRINQLAIAKSNIWPGAFNYFSGNVCESIYFGWGQKYISRNFSPEHVPQMQYECTFNILEESDPTPMKEEDWDLSHLSLTGTTWPLKESKSKSKESKSSKRE